MPSGRSYFTPNRSSGNLIIPPTGYSVASLAWIINSGICPADSVLPLPQSNPATNLQPQASPQGDRTADGDQDNRARPPQIIRHYTTEANYLSIVHTNNYVFNASLTTDPRDSQNSIFFGNIDPHISVSPSIVPNLFDMFDYPLEYRNYSYHPVAIQDTYGLGNSHLITEVFPNEELWPKCFIDVDLNKLRDAGYDVRYRYFDFPEWVLYTEETLVDLTFAVIMSGPVSLLDMPKPPLPEVPLSSCVGGNKRILAPSL